MSPRKPNTFHQSLSLTRITKASIDRRTNRLVIQFAEGSNDARNRAMLHRVHPRGFETLFAVDQDESFVLRKWVADRCRYSVILWFDGAVMLKDCAMSGVRWYSGINLEFKRALPLPSPLLYLSYPGESSSRFSPLERQNLGWD